MDSRKNEIKKKAIYPLVIIVLCFVVEFLANLSVITLPKNERGEITLSNPSQLNGFKKENNKYVLSEDEGEITWELEDRYVDKFVYNYETPGFLNAEIEIGYKNRFGKEAVLAVEDNNPLVLRSSTVNVDKNVSWISIHVVDEINEQQVKIYNPAIKNKVLINKFRICSILIVLLMVFLMWHYRKIVCEKIEYGFVIVALCIGLIMVINLPINKVGWDEETHFSWAYRTSLIPGGEMLSPEIKGQFNTETFYNWPLNQPSSYEENIQWNGLENNYYKNGDKSMLIEGDFTWPASMGLIIQSVAIKIARGIGLPFTWIFFSGRLAGLLLYIVMIYFAIKIIPIGKRILTFISLTPTSMFLAVCYTYDIVVYAGITLGIAIILKEWLVKERCVNTRTMVLGYGILFFGMLPKAVYAPLALIGFMIPKDKYRNKKQKRYLMFVYVLVICLLIAVFVLPMLFAPENMSDTRGGEVDAVEQVRNVLIHPLDYAIVLFKNIIQSLPEYAFGEGCYRLMGHLPTAGFKYLIPIMSVLLILTDREENPKIKIINLKQRIILFVFLGMATVLVWTALYVSFTVPGATEISGVQGRYFRPLLPLLYIAMGSSYVKVDISYRRYSAIILGVCMFIMGITATNIFMMFHM